MMKKINSVLISVYNKEGLEPIVRLLHQHGIKIYSTGGTQNYINSLGIDVVSIESVTDYPSIFGGRVKTLHPKVFGGILHRRNNNDDLKDISTYQIPEIDMVIVDLYPFTETRRDLTSTHSDIIEKIDIGGVSLIRAAAKNYSDVLIVSNQLQYNALSKILESQQCSTTTEQRFSFASQAFDFTSKYDSDIANYFKSNEI